MKNFIIGFALMAVAAFSFTACGHSDELTPDVVTVTDEAIQAPSATPLTDAERDTIAAQQAEINELKANY